MQEKKKITETMYQINKNQLSFRTPTCHYNGILLMACSNKIIQIKIMHRLK